MSKKGQPKQAKHGAGRFAMMPSCACYDARLTAEEVATLACIATYLNSRESPWWPIGQGEVAAKRGTLRTTTNRIVKHLVELGYLEQRAQSRKAGGKIESLYFMNMHVEVPREHRRVQIDEPETEEQSETEASGDVVLETDVVVERHPLSSQDDIPVVVERHPRRPRTTSNIRMTDHLTDHLTEMASPSSETADPEPDPEPEGGEPTWNEVHAWARTAIGREALAYFGEKGRWQYRLQRQACEDWARAHPVQWEMLRESLASDARPAPAGLVGT